MDTRKIFRLAIFSSLILSCLTSIQNARAQPAKAESPCDKDGPFAPRVDQDLLRNDLVVKPAELVKRGRTPNQAKERGVCQDAQTGKPFILPDPPRGSGKVYPEATKEILVCRGATTATCGGATGAGMRLRRFS